jgi:hypothetical protein
MLTPDRKVRKLMTEYEKTGNLTKAAMRVDLDVKTARKYLRAGRLPTQMREGRHWRTRPDPFEAQWEECARILEDAPELEGKFLFEWLCEQYPGEYQEGQLRTFQRRVRQWRALKGPDKEIFFPQCHEPGRRMATDWTHMDELGITIHGEAYRHLLCHCVLTYSNWQWVTVCRSESLLALRRGMQAALFRLGHVPREHWTDNCSAATHRPGPDEGTRRQFNDQYLALMKHFGMVPRTIQVGAAHENGDVESLNGALKRRIRQYLLLRGSSDFADVSTYRRFLAQVLEQANARRGSRLAEELARMPKLNVSRLADYTEYRCRVMSWGTITVDRRIYSVPGRLIGEKVVARRYEEYLEVFFNGVFQFRAPWVARESGHAINYRHLIGRLVRKPGAFRNYRFKSALFPTDEFRWAYDALSASGTERTADREYLQILHHAAQTMESSVVGALRELREQGAVPRLDRVLELSPPPIPVPPRMRPLRVSLAEYDRLLGEGVAV